MFDFCSASFSPLSFYLVAQLRSGSFLEILKTRSSRGGDPW
jgi:hypothetical protein